MVLPPEVMQSLGLQLGDTLLFDIADHHVVLTKQPAIPQSMEELKAIETLLAPEWLSEEDEKAYADL